MGKRLAALLVLAAGTALSGCVAAVIPAIAGTTILGKRVLDKEGKEAAPEQASASTPAPAPVPESGPDVAVAPASDASDPSSQPELSLPERIPGFATRPAPADLPAPAPVIPPAPAQIPAQAAAYPDPDLPLTPGQASFARFVRYTQSSARQAAQGAELPSAMLSDAISLDGKRRRCSVGEQLVAVIDLDPAGGIFAPPATPEKLPGLALGLAVLREAGVEIAWMSELSTTQSGTLRTALEQSGLDPRGQDIISLKRDDGDAKAQRLASLAAITCIVAIAGDERPDFDMRYKYLRTPEAGAALDTVIGDGWFLIEPLLGE